LCLTRGINSVINSHCCCKIPRVRPKSTYNNNNVYWSESWYHVSDTKVRITTTMSIYHRDDATLLCLTRGINFVINRHCCCNTYLWVWHMVSTLWSIDIVVVIRVCITTTMYIYHRVDTTCQIQKYVLQQQRLFITELIPRVRPKR
jgi:hypothetical protein